MTPPSQAHILRRQKKEKKISIQCSCMKKSTKALTFERKKKNWPGAKPEKAIEKKMAADAGGKDKRGDRADGDFKITPRAEVYVYTYYVYIYYMYICTHTHTHTHTYTHTHIHTHIHKHTYTHKRTYTLTHTMYVCMYVYTYVYIYIYIYIHIYAYIHIYMYIHICT